MHLARQDPYTSNHLSLVEGCQGGVEENFGFAITLNKNEHRGRYYKKDSDG
jgi:hypothetical protein